MTPLKPHSMFAVAVAETIPVRLAAYFPDGGVSEERVRFDCDDDDNSLHFGAFLDGRLVGAAALSINVESPRTANDAPWRLRAMAVHPQFQGNGIGAALLQYAMERVATAGGGLIWGTIRNGAYEFYERNGFILHSDVFFIRPGSSPHRYGELLVRGVVAGGSADFAGRRAVNEFDDA